MGKWKPESEPSFETKVKEWWFGKPKRKKKTLK